MAKADIITNERGYRGVNRAKELQGPPAPTAKDQTETRLAKLEADLAATKAELAKVKADLAGFKITGDGLDFDGEGPQGITGSLPSGAGGARGTPVAIEMCDGSTGTVLMLNYTPPP